MPRPSLRRLIDRARRRGENYPDEEANSLPDSSHQSSGPQPSSQGSSSQHPSSQTPQSQQSTRHPPTEQYSVRILIPLDPGSLFPTGYDEEDDALEGARRHVLLREHLGLFGAIQERMATNALLRLLEGLPPLDESGIDGMFGTGSSSRHSDGYDSQDESDVRPDASQRSRGVEREEDATSPLSQDQAEQMIQRHLSSVRGVHNPGRAPLIASDDGVAEYNQLKTDIRPAALAESDDKNVRRLVTTSARWIRRNMVTRLTKEENAELWKEIEACAARIPASQSTTDE